MDLIGISDVARLANVSRARAYALASKEGFPVPVAEGGAYGRLWQRAQVEAWIAEWEERKRNRDWPRPRRGGTGKKEPNP